MVPRTDRAGLAIADQLVRAIWTGQTINASSTIFNVTNGTLGLDSVMSTTTGTTTLRYFYLSGGRIVEQDNGGTVQYISPADLSVTKLYFTQLTSSAPSVAVRFQIDIAYTIKSITQKKTYTGFAILKNSYK